MTRRKQFGPSSKAHLDLVSSLLIKKHCGPQEVEICSSQKIFNRRPRLIFIHPISTHFNLLKYAVKSKPCVDSYNLFDWYSLQLVIKHQYHLSHKIFQVGPLFRIIYTWQVDTRPLLSVHQGETPCRLKQALLNHLLHLSESVLMHVLLLILVNVDVVINSTLKKN